ncbi:MAG TPA: SH3 domain-containing protein, partial [Bacteroidales bacterium]|nr:SH3 domain-containing protein [Bacteroidales bacterium]
MTATKLNIRDSPSAQSAVIGQVEKGDALIVKSLGKVYANVLTKYGEGFVAREYIQVENSNSFYSFIETASMREIISVLIPLLIVALLILRILGFFLSKFSSLDYSYAPRFNFFLTNRNGFFRRRFNSTVYLMLGRRTQHPYLNYWIF